jgi:hypothetical protein
VQGEQLDEQLLWQRAEANVAELNPTMHNAKISLLEFISSSFFIIHTTYYTEITNFVTQD